MMLGVEADTHTLVAPLLGGGARQRVVFNSPSLREGDRAAWVPMQVAWDGSSWAASAASCDAEADADPAAAVGPSAVVEALGAISTTSTTSSTSASGAASFALGAAGRLMLCYRFGSEPYFTAFEQVTAVVVRVGDIAPAAVPTLIAGCEVTTIHLSGAGFGAAASAGVDFLCSWSNGASATPLLLGDGEMRCDLPAPSATPSPSPPPSPTTTLTMALVSSSPAAYAYLPVATSLTVYNPSAMSLASLSPLGGGYRLQTEVRLRGSGLVDRGGIRCRFGGADGYSGGGGAAGGTEQEASCQKLAFPDSARGLTGSMAVEVALNGQCFAPTAATFHVPAPGCNPT